MQNEQTIAGVKEGDVLAGKYRIDKVLGVGGMGVVVAAHHIHLDDRVAIKFMLPHALTNQEAVNRFAREARAAVKIKSEHVARVSDVGTLENGAPYMVMEYLEGRDLSAWLQERGVLPIEQAVDFVLQACEALAEAHTLGIVHRDLKPANLFVIRTPDGQFSVKVLDFGISKMTKIPGASPSSDMDMTKTSAMMGSPLYMSPEQMQSAKEVDARSDIWAVGVILYELMAGIVPFLSESLPEVLVKIMQAEPDPVRSRRPDLPVELERVILRCLEKDRAKRYPTVGALAAELVPFGPRRARISLERISGIMQGAGLSASASALPPSTDGVRQALSAAGTEAAWGQTAAVKPKSQRTVLLVAGAALGVVAIATGVYLSTGSGNAEAEAPLDAPAGSATLAAQPPAPSSAPAPAPAQPRLVAVPVPVQPPEPVVKLVPTSSQGIPVPVPTATTIRKRRVPPPGTPRTSAANKPLPATATGGKKHSVFDER